VSGRQILRQLLVSSIAVTPRIEGGVLLYFDFAGTISYALFDMATATMRPERRDVTGRIARRVQRWCPRGDSNTRHAV
jgi:hypothetical protein